MLFVSCLRNHSVLLGNEDILSFSKSCVIFHIYICYVPEMTFGVGCEMGQVSFFSKWLSYQPHIEKIPLAPVSAAFFTNQGSVNVRISVSFGSLSCTLCLCVYAGTCGHARWRHAVFTNSLSMTDSSQVWCPAKCLLICSCSSSRVLGHFLSFAFPIYFRFSLSSST